MNDTPLSPLDEWVDKQILLQKLKMSNRTLQNLRTKQIIHHSCLGGKIYYHLPSIIAMLKDNIVFNKKA